LAAAIVEGRIVAITQATATGRQFANVATETHADYRCRGYSTAGASLVARRLQERGLTPVWSAGHTNAASLRVAAKIGFEPHGRKVYVAPCSKAG
jgi:predicted GNAT family acetyltransferase